MKNDMHRKKRKGKSKSIFLIVYMPVCLDSFPDLAPLKLFQSSTAKGTRPRPGKPGRTSCCIGPWEAGTRRAVMKRNQVENGRLSLYMIRPKSNIQSENAS